MTSKITKIQLSGNILKDAGTIIRESNVEESRHRENTNGMIHEFVNTFCKHANNNGFKCSNEYYEVCTFDESPVEPIEYGGFYHVDDYLISGANVVTCILCVKSVESQMEYTTRSHGNFKLHPGNLLLIRGDVEYCKYMIISGELSYIVVSLYDSNQTYRIPFDIAQRIEDIIEWMMDCNYKIHIFEGIINISFPHIETRKLAHEIYDRWLLRST